MKYNLCVKKVGESVRTWWQSVNNKKHKVIYEKVEINEALKRAVHEYVEKYKHLPLEIVTNEETYCTLVSETLSEVNVRIYNGVEYWQGIQLKTIKK